MTKSGTNQLTGSVFEYFRDDALDARNVVQPRAAAEERLPQPAVRRIARRPDRQGQDVLLRRLRRTARARRPAGDEPRARAPPTLAARHQSRDSAARGAQSVAGAERRPAPGGRRGESHLDDRRDQPRRQPDRQDRSAARRRRHPDRALLLRRQRSELSARRCSAATSCPATTR